MDKDKAFDLVDKIHEKRRKEIYSQSIVEHEFGLYWMMWFVNCLYQEGYEIAPKIEEVNNSC